MKLNQTNVLSLGPFTIEAVGLTHSIPEMHAMAIKTRLGTVMHTGDWKFDDEPVCGPAPNYNSLAAYGDEGVLALVCDSTNVFSSGCFRFRRNGKTKFD